jgi:hypothetical protein
MADKSNDALAYWQKMFVEMQKGFNAFANQAMASSQFSRMMTPSGGAAPKQLGEVMEKYLVSMNMPSRAQLADLAERLQAIESQLNEIKALLQQNPPLGQTPSKDSPSTPVRPPRAKRTPASPAGEQK